MIAERKTDELIRLKHAGGEGTKMEHGRTPFI